MEGRKSPEFYEYLEKVRALTLEYREHIAPTPGDEVDDEQVPEGDMLPDRIIIIQTWLDSEGDEWLTRCNEDMPTSYIKGILHRQLFED